MNKGVFAQAVTIGVIVASLGFAAGCDDGGEPSDPRSKVEAVQEALESPSGSVDANTLADLTELNAKVLSSTLLYNSASVHANVGSPCYEGDLTGGSVDLACATKDQPEEQQLSGTIIVNAEVSAGLTSADVFAELTYEDVCNATQCVDGVIATETLVEEGNTQVTIALSLDMTEDGKTTHVFWGSDISIQEDEISAKIALWDSLDHSFVMESSVTPEGVSFTVTGANGTFSCEANSEGGSCTGDAEINF